VKASVQRSAQMKETLRRAKRPKKHRATHSGVTCVPPPQWNHASVPSTFLRSRPACGPALCEAFAEPKPPQPYQGVSLSTTPDDVFIGTCTGMLMLQAGPRSPAMSHPAGGVSELRLSVTALPRPIVVAP